MTPAKRPALLAGVVVALLSAVACATGRGSHAGEPPPPRRDDEYDHERDRRERDTPSREVEGAAYPAGWQRRSDAPRVRLWIDRNESTFRRGDRVRALFRVDDDAYVTVVRVDTDGRLRVLYPTTPYSTARVRGDHSYRVPGSSAGSFVVDDATGLGYVFAIASYEPFDYARVSYGRAWDYHAAGFGVTGDPFLAVRRFADRIAYDDRTGYSTAYDEYHVGRRVDYPRYACYDCHAAGSYPARDPYGYPCPRYRVVVYHDSYYYPYRYYPGTRVVYAPRPRYEFKPASASSPTPGGPRSGSPVSGGSVVEHRRRDADADLRRPGSPTSDPNLPARTPGNAGATRPGDDVAPAQVGGRRRVDDAASAPVETPREGLRTPRRDPEPAADPSAPGGGGTPPGSPPTNGDDDDRRGRGPRRDPPGQTRDDDRGRPDDVPRREDPPRRDDPPAGGTSPDEPRESPRRADPPRRDDDRVEREAPSRQAEEPVTGRGSAPAGERRAEPRSESRPAEPRAERAPRAEPRRTDAPRSEGRKSSDKKESRRPTETRRRSD